MSSNNNRPPWQPRRSQYIHLGNVRIPCAFIVTALLISMLCCCWFMFLSAANAPPRL